MILLQLLDTLSSLTSNSIRALAPAHQPVAARAPPQSCTVASLAWAEVKGGLFCHHGCRMAKFDPFLSLDCARGEGVGRNPREEVDQILQCSVVEP